MRSATTLQPGTCWPRHSGSLLRRASSASSSTRALRSPGCSPSCWWAGGRRSSRPRRPGGRGTGAESPPRGEAERLYPGLVEPLSAREQEVLALLAAGHRNRDIAAELVITLDTVKRHVTHVFDKLGVTSRTQAAARARQLGLLP